MRFCQFLGHPDTISSIWKSMILHRKKWKNRILAIKTVKKLFWPSVSWMYSELPQNFIIFLQKKNRSIIVDFRTIFRFFSIFPNLDFWARFWGLKFQIDQILSVCPEKSWNFFFFCLKLELGHRKQLFRAQKNVLGTANGWFWHFLTPVRGILTQKTAILTYFRCFLMILQDLNYWAACRGCARVHKTRKKSKSPKMSLMANRANGNTNWCSPNTNWCSKC